MCHCKHDHTRQVLYSPTYKRELIEDLDFNFYFIDAYANCRKDPRQYTDWESLIDNFTSFFDKVFLIKCPVYGMIDDDDNQDDDEYAVSTKRLYDLEQSVSTVETNREYRDVSTDIMEPP